MFDLLTVVFRDELDILRVQAQSIDLYCQNIGIQSIFVIVNDDDIIADQIDPAWWGALSNYVTVVKRSSFNTEFVDNGWVSQQVLKILGSLLSRNKYTIVLDAKTIFVQNLNISNIITDTGLIRFGRGLVPEVFSTSQTITNNLFGVNLTHALGPTGVPFVFQTDVLYSMTTTVENLVNEPFAKWFQDQGMLTEFILYTGYLLKIHSDYDKFCTSQYHIVVNVCHSEVGIFDIKYQEMNKDNTLTVSVHRNAWMQLTDQQKQKFVELLLDKNITSAKDLL